MQPDGYRWDTLPNVSTRAKLRLHPLQNIQITNLLGDNENWYWESEPDVDWFKSKASRKTMSVPQHQEDAATPALFRSSDAWNSEMASLILVIKDTATTSTSDDATLSALTVNDGTNDLTLDPTFAPGNYVYAADVDNAVDEMTLTATVNDDGAEVSGVTLGGTAIADSDFTDGITVPSLV